MSGLAFLSDAKLVDTRAMKRVLASNPAERRIEVEAGIQWPELIAATHALDGQAAAGSQPPLGIARKQTGADHLDIREPQGVEFRAQLLHNHGVGGQRLLRNTRPFNPRARLGSESGTPLDRRRADEGQKALRFNGGAYVQLARLSDQAQATAKTQNPRTNAHQGDKGFKGSPHGEVGRGRDRS